MTDKAIRHLHPIICIDSGTISQVVNTESCHYLYLQSIYIHTHTHTHTHTYIYIYSFCGASNNDTV